MRNTIQWLLKNPRLEENFISFAKKNDLITIKLNSLISGNVKARILTPEGQTINIILNDNKNGILEGSFKSNAIGKFKIIFKNKERSFVIGEISTVEILDVRSTDTKINSFLKENLSISNFFSVFWASDRLPKIVKVYNNKILSGKSWIGIKENNITKTGFKYKKHLFKWYIIFIILASLIFISWYKEGKD